MAQQNTTRRGTDRDYDVGDEYDGWYGIHRLDYSDTFTKEVDSIEDAREAQRNAEALGFELRQAAFRGNWEAQNRSGDYPHTVVFGSDNVRPVLGLGRTWFKTVVDGKVERVRPGEGSSVRDAGTIVLEFVEGDD